MGSGSFLEGDVASEEAEAKLEEMKGELGLVKECFHIIKSGIEEGMHQQIEGENELQMKLLLSIQLERYFGNLARELAERAEIRLNLMGISKTGAKKRIVNMQEMAKQFQM